jgi:CheY-like chemotaxis protein
MSRTVLVADDEPALLRLMEYLLTREGHRLLTATNGDEALQIARDERPDLVVLDIMMPRQDGYMVAQAIRADTVIGKTPIIMLSARAQEEDIARGVAVGVDTYLTKPFSPEQLLELVATYLAEAA